MKKVDVAVIGGGILGCFAAREMTRFRVSAILIEKREDICTGISKANTAIVYPGYDHKPGTLKARMTLSANTDFERLCGELEVPFTRCGSLMLSYGAQADAVLRKKLENGRIIGVPGLRLLSGSQARDMEPCLSEGISSAIYSPATGTTDPWELCYAAFENAAANGCGFLPDTELVSIARDGGGYVLETTAGDLFAGAVINCGGLCSDKIHEMLFAPSARIRADGADYMIIQRGSAELSHIIQQETNTGDKGLTAVPTVGGSILLGPTRRETEDEPDAVSADGLAQINRLCKAVLPGLKDGKVIRSFSAVRPNPYGVMFKDGEYVPDGRRIDSFVIENPEPGFISFIGIKTPGLTCACQLGALAAERIAGYLGAEKRRDFAPERRAIVRARDADFNTRAELIERNGDYGDIVCLCEDVSKAEVLEAISRGAVTVDGVKRRCGVMLGECQGSRCEARIAELIADTLHIPVDAVTKAGSGTGLYGGGHG
jgi:glycerol-3-phosphate dehydrogenase